MGKMYTLDKKLLTEKPEIRIGDKCYPIDNRVKTVEKINKEKSEEMSSFENIERILVLLMGKQAVKEINFYEMPMPAARILMELAVAAATGEEPEDVSARFQESGDKQSSAV